MNAGITRQVVAFDRIHGERKSIAGGRARRQEYLDIYDEYLPDQYRGPYHRLKWRLYALWRLQDSRVASIILRTDLVKRAIMRSIRNDAHIHPYILNMLSIAKPKVQYPREAYAAATTGQSLDAVLRAFRQVDGAQQVVRTHAGVGTYP